MSISWPKPFLAPSPISGFPRARVMAEAWFWQICAFLDDQARRLGGWDDQAYRLGGKERLRHSAPVDGVEMNRATQLPLCA